MKDEFTYNNLVINRGDYEGLPCPMNTENISDATMQKITKEIYETLANYYSFTEKDLQEYLTNSDELMESDPEMWENIDQCWWREMENIALDNGMTYYED